MSYADFRWVKCADGYAVVDEEGEFVNDITSTNVSSWELIPNSTNFVRLRPFKKRFSLPLREFAKAEDAGDYLNLANVYGLLTADGRNSEYVSSYESVTSSLRIMLHLADEANRATDENIRQQHYEEICQTFNNVSWGATKAILTPCPDRPPAINYRPINLQHALWACFSEMLQFETGHKKCTVCSVWYVPIRNRKSKNNYCSTKCANQFNNEKSRREKLEVQK